MLDDGNGFERRKPVRRTAKERAAIVAESCELGARVSAVARRHWIVPSQLSTWRSAARVGKSGSGSRSQFVDVAILADPVASPPSPHDGVEIMVGPVLIRLPKSTPATRIADIAQRLARQG
ncbi:MAG: transposase [Rhodobacteraceae bacterium]|nr:transposase [Paracoccaceae bacterium]